MLNTWTEQVKNQITYFGGDQTPYPFFISPFFDDHINKMGSPKSLTNQFYPSSKENSSQGSYDPIGDINNHQADKIIHRYKNRVLVTPTTVCPVNCRYCFRKNTLAMSDDLFKGQWQKTLEYLNNHSEVEEVIFTGGDPLMMSNQKINNYLNDLTQIPHIKYVRFHTRTPIIIPQRIDEEFVGLLDQYSRKFKKLLIVIHTNHIDEFSNEFKTAIEKLCDLRVELLSQSVLLKDVNDNPNDLKTLFQQLSELGVRPYYLHHPDKVKGGMHFYLSLEQGRKIYSQLRDQLSGYMIPNYVVDIDGGMGKVAAFNPETFKFSGQLINKNAQLSAHNEPKSNTNL